MEGLQRHAERYERPWMPGHFAEPNLATVGDSLDVHRAHYDNERATLHFTAGVRDGGSGAPVIALANVWDRGTWELRRDGRTVATGNGQDVHEGRSMDVRRREQHLDLHLARADGVGSYTLSWSGGVR